jgi:DNA-directed RNA polymerase beta subunit
MFDARARQVDINTEVGVVHDIRLQELRLYTDFGRCCRPLFIVDRQALRIKKSHIRMLQGLVEEQKLVWQARARPGRQRAPAPRSCPGSARAFRSA